jgi:hypothetical protein
VKSLLTCGKLLSESRNRSLKLEPIAAIIRESECSRVAFARLSFGIIAQVHILDRRQTKEWYGLHARCGLFF